MENYSIVDDIHGQINATSRAMLTGDSETRQKESKIYESQVKCLIELERLKNEESEALLRSTQESRKIDLERFKEENANSRLTKQIWMEFGKGMLIGSTGIAYVGLSLLGFKYNLQYGKLIGQDGQNYAKEILRLCFK